MHALRLAWPVALLAALFGCGGGGGGGGNAVTGNAGTLIVAWTAPASNADGTTPADVAGYRVSYGTDARQLSQSMDVSGASSSNAQITGLPAGTYYVSVQALSATGLPSDPSNTAVVTLP